MKYPLNREFKEVETVKCIKGLEGCYTEGTIYTAYSNIKYPESLIIIDDGNNMHTVATYENQDWLRDDWFIQYFVLDRE